MARDVALVEEAVGVSELGPPFADPALRRELAGPLLRAFRAIADEWGLSTEQRIALLGAPPRSTYFYWQQMAAQGGAPSTLSADDVTRLSVISSIFALLEQWRGDAPPEASAWVVEPNAHPTFGGRPPLEFMIHRGIDGLAQTERYLTAVVGAPNVLAQAHGAATQAADERAADELRESARVARGTPRGLVGHGGRAQAGAPVSVPVARLRVEDPADRGRRMPARTPGKGVAKTAGGRDRQGGAGHEGRTEIPGGARRVAAKSIHAVHGKLASVGSGQHAKQPARKSGAKHVASKHVGGPARGPHVTTGRGGRGGGR